MYVAYILSRHEDTSMSTGALAQAPFRKAFSQSLFAKPFAKDFANPSANTVR